MRNPSPLPFRPPAPGGRIIFPLLPATTQDAQQQQNFIGRRQSEEDKHNEATIKYETWE